ncbi:hypothetical protein MC378_03190 [Polaribacter sp. MSW13]|uniref:Uncharacterized protein n=1 Tax=Polaribacter marinus TaxID=2916838 RepID=A0A9X1VKG2_9FLAO|nr:hypothetical protein [Polaribacter marinus]MCI2228159.1 hypothetical protein [Polaribacter marinus]
MEKKNQLIKVLLLISIYCFGVFISANSSLGFNTHRIGQENEQKVFLSTASKVLFTHGHEFENLLSDLTEYTTTNLKLSFNDFWTISYSNQLLFNAKFKQYKNHLKTLLIRQRKSDLIFPFHNFW